MHFPAGHCYDAIAVRPMLQELKNPFVRTIEEKPLPKMGLIELFPSKLILTTTLVMYVSNMYGKSLIL